MICFKSSESNSVDNNVINFAFFELPEDLIRSCKKSELLKDVVKSGSINVLEPECHCKSHTKMDEIVNNLNKIGEHQNDSLDAEQMNLESNIKDQNSHSPLHDKYCEKDNPNKQKSKKTKSLIRKEKSTDLKRKHENVFDSTKKLNDFPQEPKDSDHGGPQLAKIDI